MKVKKSVLVRLVREELARHVRSLFEDSPKDEPDVVDAEVDGPAKKKKGEPPAAKGPEKGKKKTGPEKEPAGKKPLAAKAPPAQKKGGTPPELPAVDAPDDAELEKGADDVEEPAELTGGKIADEVTGKRIQSITMDPKSKIMPGATELVLTFDEIPDPLRVLIGKTGKVLFYLRGLHNKL